jgi:uncharacterized protein YjbI with pentapeptide repeats
MGECQLRGAVFLKVDFSRAIRRSRVVQGSELRSCNLELADLSGAQAATSQARVFARLSSCKPI